MLTSDYLDARLGGVEHHIYNLSRELIRRGHEVGVVRVSPDPPQYEPPPDVPYVYHFAARAARVRSLTRWAPGMAGELLVRLAQNLDHARALRELEARLGSSDVVHQHDFLANIVLSKKLASRWRVVWTNHLGETLILNKHAIGRSILRGLTKHFGGVMAPSRELAAASGVPVSQVTQVANGVDDLAFSPRPGRNRYRASRGWRAGEVVLLVPRRWSPTKGVDVAAEALVELHSAQRVRAVFVGASDFEYPVFARRVHQLLAKSAVTIEIHPALGHNELAEMYSAADVVVIPSRLEATSLSALEAMASGCIVIASRVGGLPELIRDGVTGFLVPPEDAHELARCIGRVANLSDDDRRVMGAAARARVIEQGWTWRAVATRALSVYAATTRPE